MHLPVVLVSTMVDHCSCQQQAATNVVVYAVAHQTAVMRWLEMHCCGWAMFQGWKHNTTHQNQLILCQCHQLITTTTTTNAAQKSITHCASTLATFCTCTPPPAPARVCNNATGNTCSSMNVHSSDNVVVVVFMYNCCSCANNPCHSFVVAVHNWRLLYKQAKHNKLFINNNNNKRT